jgi:uncharacterized protein with HEPN domain
MRDDDRVRILHMIDAAEALEEFALGKKRGDLDTDRMFLFAVVRAIEVIGEAASRVTRETQDATPEVPWAAVVGMRNKLIHGYFDIDADVVWKTVTAEVPALRHSLEAVVGKP